MTQHHPCGSLPVYTVRTTAFYCAHHLAWWCHAEVVRQDGDDAAVTVYERQLELGPFDGVEDVTRWLGERLATGLRVALDRAG